MNCKLKLSALVFTAFVFIHSNAQLPLVYEEENTGAGCEKPPLPDPSGLQNYPFLPDPFAWSDGSGRVDTFPEWECRRNEIKAEIEEYETGPKPDRPDTISATLSNDTLRVFITENGHTLTLTSKIIVPQGTGPFPVVIGMSFPTGALPASLFEGVIQIPFMHDQVVTYTQTSTRYPDDPYFKLYPSLNIGNYSAWAWGVSRLIDGIEIVQSELNADTKHIAVTGCSYAGKMALFSGAFDERVALTIVQESGGGGINSWRVSETIGNVEKIDNTNYSWFMASMKTNFQGKTGLLPHDHHELMAMVAPRAMLVLGNPPYEWLGDESGYVSSRAVEEVYKTFGIPERFGFSFRSGHDHCSLPAASYSEVQAFVDRFLFNDSTANTDIHVHDFYTVDYNKWIQAWKQPANPDAPAVTIDSPADGSTFDAPAEVTFTTSVTDPNNNVARIIFYNKDEQVGEDSIAPFSLELHALAPGSYYIYAEAVDSMDLRGYSNVISVYVKAPTMEVYKTGIAPVIDGIIDDIWNNDKTESFAAETKLVGTGFTERDLSGQAKMLWDDTYIYLLAEVTDDIKKNDSPNTYEDDNVEFYFDANNAKTTTYEADDVQYSFAWNDGTTVGVLPAGRSSEGITYNISDNETGYIAEIRIPWATIKGTPEDGKEIGFDFMINDDDDGGGRDGKLSWNASADQAWQDASYFGTILLKADGLSSLNEPDDMNTLSVFPNPAEKELLIKGNEKEVSYQITDMTGRMQLSGSCRNRIPVESLSCGVYMLKIMDGGKITNLKFIKD